MTGFIVGLLKKHGFDPVVAYYQPYSISKNLSVPIKDILHRSPSFELQNTYGGCEAHAIGAWLPELEFTHYFGTRYWRELIATCDAHLTVSGNVLAALPYLQTETPFLAWVATSWEEDRKDRVRGFPLLRKILDRSINSPVLRRLEKKLFKAGNILALSDYTAESVSKITGGSTYPPVLPMPINDTVFFPNTKLRVPRKIGFSGRFSDPRKNIKLLLDAVALLKGRGINLQVELVGDTPTEELLKYIESIDLGGNVSIEPYLSQKELIQHLQTFDLFVLPSFQEGLCIAALEAMACGVPVVSTHCGGPEEYIIDGQTGALVDFNAEHVAETMVGIICSDETRKTLSHGASKLVHERYTNEHAEAVFFRAFETVFPEIEVRNN